MRSAAAEPGLLPLPRAYAPSSAPSTPASAATAAVLVARRPRPYPTRGGASTSLEPIPPPPVLRFLPPAAPTPESEDDEDEVEAGLWRVLSSVADDDEARRTRRAGEGRATVDVLLAELSEGDLWGVALRLGLSPACPLTGEGDAAAGREELGELAEGAWGRRRRGAGPARLVEAGMAMLSSEVLVLGGVLVLAKRRGRRATRGEPVPLRRLRGLRPKMRGRKGATRDFNQACRQQRTG